MSRQITMRAAAVFVAEALGLPELHEMLRDHHGPLLASERALLRTSLDRVQCKHVKGSLDLQLIALTLAGGERATTRGEPPVIVLTAPGKRVPMVVREYARQRYGGRRTRGRPTRPTVAAALRAVETIVRTRTEHAPKTIVCLTMLYRLKWLFPVRRAMSSAEFMAYATKRLDKLIRDRASAASAR